MAIRVEGLIGEWIHSHEEDSGDRKVFRRATFPFGPSRGRERIELREDGTFLHGRPGFADVPETHPGRWELKGSTLCLEGGAQGSGSVRNLEIIALEPERLVLRESG